jgi:hypothetical protein
VEKGSFNWYNMISPKNLIRPTKEPVMIISENREKVKRKAQSLLSKRYVHFSKPQFKFALEMVLGIVMSGSSNLSEIGRNLKERTELKHTLKRLRRMLGQQELLDKCNGLCLEESARKMNGETILALDTGDVTHQYGEKFELLNYVHDGSSKKGKKKTEKGYWLNQVSGFNPSSNETFPVLLDIYSCSEECFKSANAESLSLVQRVVSKVGFDGLWVMDRGYDSGVILQSFLSGNLNFVVRMNISRNILVDDKSAKDGLKSVNIKAAAEQVNRRIKYNTNSRFGSLKARLKLRGVEYLVTLICFKDKRNKEPMLLLCNGWIKSTKELKRRIRGYFHRWGVEESYRFEKQGFGIEKCTLRKFSRIKNMIGLTLLSWLLLIKINESPRLREVVLKKASMEKTKRKHRPKFIYYRLLKGVRNLFAGTKELFRFRWKKNWKRKYLEDQRRQRPLFHQFPLQEDWLEVEV